jgi:hypothetical protein
LNDSIIKELLSHQQQRIALQCMQYVAAEYGDTFYRWMRERLLQTIKTWPTCEDDVTAYLVMFDVANFALIGVPPLKEEDWFDFSPEEGQGFLQYATSIRRNDKKLRNERLQQ